MRHARWAVGPSRGLSRGTDTETNSDEKDTPSERNPSAEGRSKPRLIRILGGITGIQLYCCRGEIQRQKRHVFTLTNVCDSAPFKVSKPHNSLHVPQGPSSQHRTCQQLTSRWWRTPRSQRGQSSTRAQRETSARASARRPGAKPHCAPQMHMVREMAQRAATRSDHMRDLRAACRRSRLAVPALRHVASGIIPAATATPRPRTRHHVSACMRDAPDCPRAQDLIHSEA